MLGLVSARGVCRVLGASRSPALPPPTDSSYEHRQGLLFACILHGVEQEESDQRGSHEKSFHGMPEK